MRRAVSVEQRAGSNIFSRSNIYNIGGGNTSASEFNIVRFSEKKRSSTIDKPLGGSNPQNQQMFAGLLEKI